MLTKINQIRQNLKSKASNINNQIRTWENKFNASYQKKFPFPQMEKTSLHFSKSSVEGQTLTSALSTKKILKFWLIGLGIASIGYIMYISLSYLYMVISAFIISLALEGCIIFWQRITRSRGIGILITYVIATIFVLSGFLILIPFFFNRGTELLQSFMSGLLKIESSIMELGLSEYINQIKGLPSFLKGEIIERVQEGNSNDLINMIRDNFGNIMSTSSEYVKLIAGHALSIFGNFFGIIADFAILITLSVFFSVAHYDVKYSIKYLVRHASSGISRVDAAYSGISTRLKTQIFLCIFIGFASYLGLRILERCGISIPKKGTLALIAGLLEIVPYVGPWLGAIPAAISALITSGGGGLLAVIIVYTIIQQGEEKFLVPVIVGKSLGVSPLLVFICMLFCGSIMGFLGILLAVPISVIFSLALRIPNSEELQNKFENNKQKDCSKVKSINIKSTTNKLSSSKKGNFK